MHKHFKLTLKASKLVVLFIAFPFLASFMLLVLSGAGSIIITLALILLMLIFAYYASLLGLINSPDSIAEIIVTPGIINLRDSKGIIFNAEIMQSSILLTSTGFLTFKCIEAISPNTKKLHFFNKYKHVIVCRRNVENFNNYRNLRVIARFNPHV